MPHIDVEVLTPVTARVLEGTNLTPAERSEVLRLAPGVAGKDSAAAATVSPETIRGRRKRSYRKLEVNGANDLIAVFLAVALRMLRREEVATAGTAPAADAASDASAAGA